MHLQIYISDLVGVSKYLVKYVFATVDPDVVIDIRLREDDAVIESCLNCKFAIYFSFGIC